MKTKNVTYRQGDVFIRKVQAREIPADFSKEKLDKGRVVLAYGEVTGHAHAIHDSAALWRKAGDVAFGLLEVTKKTTLRHEEHAPIQLDPGMYEVVRQREYTPEEIRFVAD
jgi:hypothetical protein